MTRCLYCGKLAYGRTACVEHRPLLTLDPHYFAPPMLKLPPTDAMLAALTRDEPERAA